MASAWRSKGCAVGVMVAGSVCGSAIALAAEVWPARPIRMIVPYAAGGNADIVGRTVASGLAGRLGQQVVVDNRPGASSIVGTELAARAPADGHTLLLVAVTFAVLPSLAGKLPYDTLKDFTPVALVGSTPQVLVAFGGLPVKHLADLVALARSRPGAINYGSNGVGSTGHMAGALLTVMAGIDLTHVPYKATQQILTDVIAGHMQLGVPSLTSTLPLVKAGRLRALGVTSLRRSPLLPEVPTIAESGVPGYQAVIWNGVLVPAGTPAARVQRLGTEIAAAMQSSEAAERYAALGAEARASTPAEFATFLRSEVDQWGRVVRESGIKVDLAR